MAADEEEERGWRDASMREINLQSHPLEMSDSLADGFLVLTIASLQVVGFGGNAVTLCGLRLFPEERLRGGDGLHHDHETPTQPPLSAGPHTLRWCCSEGYCSIDVYP
uniref:Uncharacterized protein n=1 Tax=Setaria italica TaxID=4555 RepID=K4A0C8_SETIT